MPLAASATSRTQTHFHGLQRGKKPVQRGVECFGLLEIRQMPGAGNDHQFAPPIAAAICRDSSTGIISSSAPAITSVGTDLDQQRRGIRTMHHAMDRGANRDRRLLLDEPPDRRLRDRVVSWSSCRAASPSSPARRRTGPRDRPAPACTAIRADSVESAPARVLASTRPLERSPA